MNSQDTDVQATGNQMSTQAQGSSTAAKETQKPSCETPTPSTDEKSRQEASTRILLATVILLIVGMVGLVCIFIAAFRSSRVPLGRPVPAMACSSYGCCRVTTLFNRNQVNLYFEYSDLKIRDDLTLRKGQVVLLSVDESNPACNRPIKVADTGRGFFLDLTACETIHQ